MIDRDRDHLHPLMRQALADLEAAVLDRLGITLDFLEGWRARVDQAAAKSSGASDVTFGWHNVEYPNGKPAALAVHVDPFPGRDVLGFAGKPLEWPGAVRLPIDFGSGHPRPCTAAMMVYVAVGLIGEELGLTWGGRWDHLQDWQHFELHPNGAPLSQVVAAMNADGDLHGLVKA